MYINYLNNYSSVRLQQILDTSNWIGVPNKKTLFPIEIQGSASEDLEDTSTFHVVIEADFSTFNSQNHCSNCQVNV